MIALWIALGLVAVVFLTAYICFHIVFYSKKRPKTDEMPILEGKEYDPFREKMANWVQKARCTPYREVSLRTFDGLTLRGRFYEFEKGAPIELMLHGYRGTAERDLSGGIFRAFKLGHSVLTFDHRGSGASDGHVITFGVKESRDCEAWIQYILENIDKDAKIFLTGVSMGAATVMMTAERELPENAVGVLADCGYTSAEAIIKDIMRRMKLPVPLLYPFVVLGGLIFGGFNVNKASPIKAVANSRLPILFFHGDTDDFVPHSMSLENFEACTAEKRMVTIAGAGHGLCYPVDPDGYLAAMREFLEPYLQK